MTILTIIVVANLLLTLLVVMAVGHTYNLLKSTIIIVAYNMNYLAGKFEDYTESMEGKPDDN